MHKPIWADLDNLLPTPDGIFPLNRLQACVRPVIVQHTPFWQYVRQASATRIIGKRLAIPPLRAKHVEQTRARCSSKHHTLT
jgi:hypothetical protein